MGILDKIVKDLESLVGSRTELILNGRITELEYRKLAGEVTAYRNVIESLKELKKQHNSEE